MRSRPSWPTACRSHSNSGLCPEYVNQRGGLAVAIKLGKLRRRKDRLLAVEIKRPLEPSRSSLPTSQYRAMDLDHISQRRRDAQYPATAERQGPCRQKANCPRIDVSGDRKSTRLNSSHGYIAY